MWWMPLSATYGSRRFFTSTIPKSLPRLHQQHTIKTNSPFGIYHIWHVYRKMRLDPAFAHRERQYDRWAHIDNAPDLSSALTLLGYTSGQLAPLTIPADYLEQREGLTWFVLRLIRDKVHSQQDAIAALALVSRSLQTLPPNVQPCLVVMAAFWAAKFEAMVPMQHAVTTFLNLKPDPQAFQYNVLLCATSAGPRGEATTALIKTILDAMLQRRHRMDSFTHSRLLYPKFTTASLTVAVQKFMKAQGFSPSVNHLNAPGATVVQSRPMTRQIDTSFLDDLSRGVYAPTSPSIEHLISNDVGFNDTAGAFLSTPSLSSDSASHMRMPASSTSQALDKPESSAAILLQACRDPKISIPALLALFRQNLLAHGNGRWRGVRYRYTIIVKALSDKMHFKSAAKLWKEFRTTGISLNSISVSVGVQALTKAGEPQLAFELLEEAHQVCLKAEAEMDARGLWGSLRSKVLARRELPTINRVTLHAFLTSAYSNHQLDIIFMLWDSMQLLYSIPPSDLTLSIVLQAARQSKRLSGTPHRVRAQLGSSRFVEKPHWAPEDELADPRQRCAAKIKRVLNDPSKPIGMWGNDHAYRVGLHVATQVFLWNWPHLAEVESPVDAAWGTRDAMKEFYRSMVSYREAQLRQRSSQPRTSAEAVLQLYQYPSVNPIDSLFRQYIHLLHANGLSTEVPVTLAWMRELGVEPSRDTLAVALVYWAGVARHAPPAETMKGRADLGPYAQLERWLLNWMGEDGMPSPQMITDSMKAIGRFYNMRA